MSAFAIGRVVRTDAKVYHVEILETGEQTHYEVARGDTLWKIAKRHQTDVYSVKQINGLRSSRIYVGQVLMLPTSR